MMQSVLRSDLHSPVGLHAWRVASPQLHLGDLGPFKHIFSKPGATAVGATGRGLLGGTRGPRCAGQVAGGVGSELLVHIPGIVHQFAACEELAVLEDLLRL